MNMVKFYYLKICMIFDICVASGILESIMKTLYHMILGSTVNQKWWENNLKYKKNQESLKARIEDMRSLGSTFAKRYSDILSKYRNL